MEETQNNSQSPSDWGSMQDLTSLSFNDHENGEDSQKTMGNTTPWRTEILQRLQGPPGQESTCTARLKFANDSEENWVKVLWSDETKIQLFGINSQSLEEEECCLWPSNMEVEILCFGVFFC